jgi:hypothetical protein
MARDPNEDEVFDVLMTVCLLLCVEDPARPLPPKGRLDEREVPDLMFRLRVHSELVMEGRHGTVEILKPLRISDDSLALRVTEEGRMLVHRPHTGPWRH